MLDIMNKVPYNEGCSVDKAIDDELTAVNQLAAHCQLRSFKIQHRSSHFGAALGIVSRIVCVIVLLLSHTNPCTSYRAVRGQWQVRK